MPRGSGSSTSKRQLGAANHRDTRHENGLVGPGKRVHKQKSNGHLNGHAKAPESNISPPPPLPGTGIHTSPPIANGNGNVRNSLPADNSIDNMMQTDTLRRISLSGGDSEFSSAESYHHGQENHRQIDVNATKNSAVHRDLGPLGFALTVLKSCPLGDTIAILIVLLQIPPTFLSLIHLLFATLTFVPPSSSVNAAWSIDIFEGHLGTPSVATILVIDLIVLLIWLFLWTPFQELALDLAQTVIALTLGGGTSGREGGTNNVLVCLGIIGLSHFSKNGRVKNSGLKGLLPTSWKALLNTEYDDHPISDQRPQNTQSWLRSILAIHILTQGLVRYIRDWYVRREKRDSSAAADPEVGRALDPNTEISISSGQPPDAESGLHTSAVTSKKKRKHSALVRLRQPLWSALASTKIVMVKEYETSHTAAESAGTNAKDVNDLGNAPFDTEADKVWITYVGSDEVFFSTSYFPAHTAKEHPERKDLDSGIDQAKPFYVRINNAVWSLIRINQMAANESSGREARWSGEIFGLAQTSKYECEFVSTIDDSILFATCVRTHYLPSDVAVGLSPNPTYTGRPGSPTTTLKTSIASAEIKLTEERNRQKREKKEQRTKLTALRKEIEKLSSSIASGGGNEDRQRQKLQQHVSHMKQAEDAILSLVDEIENLEPIPDDDKSPYRIGKREFQSQRDQYKQARNAFSEAKAASDREIQVLGNEIATLQQQREKKQARIAKLNGDYERITDANARGLDEAQRKERERIANEADRMNKDMMLSERLQTLKRQVHEQRSMNFNLTQNIHAVQQLEYDLYNRQQTSPNASVPNLAIGFNDGTAMTDTTAYPWVPYNYAMNSSPAQGPRTRGRSSSMLSNVSGFTQSSNEGPPPAYNLPTQHSFPNAQASPFTFNSNNPAAKNPWDESNYSPSNDLYPFMPATTADQDIDAQPVDENQGDNENESTESSSSSSAYGSANGRVEADPHPEVEAAPFKGFPVPKSKSSSPKSPIAAIDTSKGHRIGNGRVVGW